MGIPLTRAMLSASRDGLWQQLKERDERSWQQLPFMGKRRARRVIRWLGDRGVAALNNWLAAQRIAGFMP